jgi:hypothetical protein
MVGKTRTIARGGGTTIVGLLAAMASMVLAPATASAAPSAASGLIGTWTSSARSGIVKLVISKSSGGGIKVDAFSTCGKAKPCESGKLSAVVFGPSASATTGAVFETNQALASYNQVLLGRLVSTTRGRRIALDWYDVYHAGPRHNSAMSRSFKRVGRATSTRKTGTATTAYPTGRQPHAPDALVGVWHNVDPSTRGTVELDITRALDGSLLVHVFGACTPTPCDNGVTPAIAYGPSTTATTATRFLAPADYGFKRTVLAGLPISSTGVLTVNTYSEFTDGSGRSNYFTAERFTK